MKKNDKNIRIVVMSGTKELSSFEASNFSSVEEANKTLMKLVQIVSATILSISVSTLARFSKSGSISEIKNFTNQLFDLLVSSTREQITNSVDDFSKEFDTSSMKGGDA